jgi:hypothetical protein
MREGGQEGYRRFQRTRYAILPAWRRGKPADPVELMNDFGIVHENDLPAVALLGISGDAADNFAIRRRSSAQNLSATKCRPCNVV